MTPATGSPEDGYEWRGPVNRVIVPTGGTGPTGEPCSLEITNFYGGFYPPSPNTCVCRVEYRQMQPNCRLFLVQYILVDQSGNVVMSSGNAQPQARPIPAGTVNPAMIFERPLDSPTEGIATPPNNIIPQATQPSFKHPQPITQRPPMPIQAPVVQSKNPMLAQRKQPSLPGRSDSMKSGADDGQMYLAVDEDDNYSNVDVALNRLKFIKNISARLFGPADQVRPIEKEDIELCGIFEEHINALRTEIGDISKLEIDFKSQQNQRRSELNKLFDDLNKFEDIDVVYSNFEHTLGYSLTTSK